LERGENLGINKTIMSAVPELRVSPVFFLIGDPATNLL
jgi:hypothetical protein